MAGRLSTVKSGALILKKSYDSFTEDDGMRMSAALAYYSAFSVAPLLLIVVAIAGAFFGDDAVRGTLNEELRSNMGEGGAMVIQDMIANARKPADSLVMSIVGLGLLLMGAGGVFAQLQSALDTIWNVKTPPSQGIPAFIKNRFLSFSMILVSGFLLLISMMLTTILQAAGDRIGKLSGLPITTWVAGSGIFSFMIATLLFASIFKILPHAAVRWKDVWFGAFFTALLFTLGKFAVGWYLGREATSSSYGSAGSFVVVLMWLHYSCMILLFGAEFTQTYARLRGREFGESKL